MTMKMPSAQTRPISYARALSPPAAVSGQEEGTEVLSPAEGSRSSERRFDAQIVVHNVLEGNNSVGPRIRDYSGFDVVTHDGNFRETKSGKRLRSVFICVSDTGDGMYSHHISRLINAADQWAHPYWIVERSLPKSQRRLPTSRGFNLDHARGRAQHARSRRDLEYIGHNLRQGTYVPQHHSRSSGTKNY